MRDILTSLVTLMGVLVWHSGPAAANPFIAEARKPEQLIPEIVNACIDNGDAVIDTSPYMVVCEAIAKRNMASAFMGSLFYGAQNGQMKMTYRWVVAPHEAGSRVRLQVMFEADQGRGSVFREDRTENWKRDFPRTIAKLQLKEESALARPTEPEAPDPRPAGEAVMLPKNK